MHVFLSLLGNSTSWSQHSNAKHRKQNGKRPSEVHRTASHTTLTDRDENVVDICHIFSCIFWLSHLLFSTSSRFSGQTWSLLWNCMIHTSWIQRIIMSWPIPGGRSGRKGFKSLLVPNPFRSVQCGMRLFFFLPVRLFLFNGYTWFIPVFVFAAALQLRNAPLLCSSGRRSCFSHLSHRCWGTWVFRRWLMACVVMTWMRRTWLGCRSLTRSSARWVSMEFSFYP